MLMSKRAMEMCTPAPHQRSHARLRRPIRVLAEILALMIMSPTFTRTRTHTCAHTRPCASKDGAREMSADINGIDKPKINIYLYHCLRCIEMIFIVSSGRRRAKKHRCGLDGYGVAAVCDSTVFVDGGYATMAEHVTHIYSQVKTMKINILPPK